MSSTYGIYQLPISFSSNIYYVAPSDATNADANTSGAGTFSIIREKTTLSAFKVVCSNIAGAFMYLCIGY